MLIGDNMGFPKKTEVNKILKKLLKDEGTLALSKNATVLEKFRFDLCQKFLRYKIENDLTQKQLANELEIDEAKVSKILHHRIKEFSTDRLISLYSKLEPNVKLRVA